MKDAFALVFLIVMVVFTMVFGYRHFYTISSSDAAALTSMDITRFPGGKYECTISRTSFEGSSRGIMYINNGNVRINYPDLRIHAIVKGATAYMWQDGKDLGIKGPAAAAFVDPRDSQVSGREVKCAKTFSVDPNNFVLPDNVEFK